MKHAYMQAAGVGLCVLTFYGCGAGQRPAPVALELFTVAADEQGIRYVRRITPLLERTGNPDEVARGLAAGTGTPAMLHSTSWRWEHDGTIILTYLAYCEPQRFHGDGATRLAWSELVRTGATDPLHPRPAAIREGDVVAHGLRHLSFLVRYARDNRLASALSPGSLLLLRRTCGQLAGKLDAAREFEECGAVGR